MYQLKFVNQVQIGSSPYNYAEVVLNGEYVPNLKLYRFQDKGCLNKTRTSVVLIQWAVTNNEPGFIVWLISEADLSVKKTDRFEGCCEKVFFNDDENVEISYRVDDELRKKILPT